LNLKSTKNGDMFSILNYDGQIAFADISEAAKDFDIKYCIETYVHMIVCMLATSLY